MIYICEKGYLLRSKSCWEHSRCFIGEQHNFAKKWIYMKTTPCAVCEHTTDIGTQ